MGAVDPILSEIFSEVEYQESRWGTESDDTRNTPWMWSAYIAQYATRWMAGTFAPLKSTTVFTFRKSMIKVAAIAVAAVRSIDRQRAANGHAFYEEK